MDTLVRSLTSRTMIFCCAVCASSATRLPGTELEAEKHEAIEPRARPGRPRVWDWDGALMHLLKVAQHPDGLPTGPGAQAQLERLVSDWFIETTGNAPSTSQVR